MDNLNITNRNEQEDNTNNNLISNISTLDELKVYLRLKFQSYKQAGIKAGISEGRVRQILIAYDLPKTSRLINQIARGWDIDPVKLALMFEESRK